MDLQRLKKTEGIGEAVRNPQQIDYNSQPSPMSQGQNQVGYSDTKAKQDSLYEQIKQDALLRNEQRFNAEMDALRRNLQERRQSELQSRQEMQNIRQDALRGLDRSATARGMHGSGFDALGRVQTMAQLGSGFSDLERASSEAMQGVLQGMSQSRDTYESGIRQANLDYSQQMAESDAQFQSERKQMGLDIMELMSELVNTGQKNMFERMLVARGLDLGTLSDSQRAVLADVLGNSNYLNPDYKPFYDDKQPEGGGGGGQAGGYKRGLAETQDQWAIREKQKWVVDGKVWNPKAQKNAFLKGIQENEPELYKKFDIGDGKAQARDILSIMEDLIAGKKVATRGGAKAATSEEIEKLKAMRTELATLDYNPNDGVDRPFKIKGIDGKALSFDNPYQVETFVQQVYGNKAHGDKLRVVVHPSGFGTNSIAGNMSISFENTVTGKRFKTYNDFVKHASGEK